MAASDGQLVGAVRERHQRTGRLRDAPRRRLPAVGAAPELGVSDGHGRRMFGLHSVDVVDRKEEIREFLISRRAKVSPERAGILSYGDLRRMPGLRREAVAQPRGVSTDNHTRLERGSIRDFSDSVL